MAVSTSEESLIQKLRLLPPERLEEVEDFVDFLRAREGDRALVQASARASAAAFSRVWDNPEDAAYDAL